MSDKSVSDKAKEIADRIILPTFNQCKLEDCPTIAKSIHSYIECAVKDLYYKEVLPLLKQIEELEKENIDLNNGWVMHKKMQLNKIKELQAQNIALVEALKKTYDWVDNSAWGGKEEILDEIDEALKSQENK